jgi:hydrogenase expression/formation protein HypC
MRVVEIKGDSGDPLMPQTAVVDADGMIREVRLDLTDRPAVVGDYLIVHAGFAIHTLTEEDALVNLQLMREMAAGLTEMDNDGSGSL